MTNSILFAGGEILPFAATGGLGDVLGSLPEAVKRRRRSMDVRAVMPLYSKVSAEWRKKMTFVKSITVKVAWRQEYCGIFSLKKGGVMYYFIDNEKYFSRPSLYGEFDDAERFAFFSGALLDLMSAVDFFPQVLHANDWQTAPAVIMLKSNYSSDERYKAVKAIYTIHNVDYQGDFDMSIYDDVFGFDWKVRDKVDFYGRINLTKGAVELADFITTVSPNYARQIQTPEYAHGLDGVLSAASYKLDGIINGIDYKLNDPENDPDIPKNFSSDDLSGKAECKAELQRRFGLEVRRDVPLIAMISRLAGHKGFDLVMRVCDEMMQNDVQFVLLGTGEKQYEEFFRRFADRHQKRAGVSISYDRKLSKLIYAGADMFLMPSKSEACGLAQMIASRYGTVPIVRETGGLYDTIKPYGAGGNGFTFSAYNAHDMLYVIREAEGVYRDADKWHELMLRAMSVDFSWGASAKKYISMYDKIIK